MKHQLLAVSFAMSIAAHAALAQDGGKIVEAASRKYKAVSSFQAHFRQLIEDKSIDNSESKGMLYQEGRNHLAFRWSDPADEAIVLDGTFVWMYFPSTSPGRVLQYPQQNHPTYGNDIIGTFLDDPVSRYNITYVTTENIDGHPTDAVLMEPKTRDPNFLRATVWLDRVSGLPRRIEVQEKGQKRTLYLSQIISNPSINPSIFKFDPKGLKIIKQ